MYTTSHSDNHLSLTCRKQTVQQSDPVKVQPCLAKILLAATPRRRQPSGPPRALEEEEDLSSTTRQSQGDFLASNRLHHPQEVNIEQFCSNSLFLVTPGLFGTQTTSNTFGQATNNTFGQAFGARSEFRVFNSNQLLSYFDLFSWPI